MIYLSNDFMFYKRFGPVVSYDHSILSSLLECPLSPPTFPNALVIVSSSFLAPLVHQIIELALVILCISSLLICEMLPVVTLPYNHGNKTLGIQVMHTILHMSSGV